jgi:predicted NUDIX family NTP pyrophosphohydrolase
VISSSTNCACREVQQECEQPVNEACSCPNYYLSLTANECVQTCPQGATVMGDACRCINGYIKAQNVCQSCAVAKLGPTQCACPDYILELNGLCVTSCTTGNAVPDLQATKCVCNSPSYGLSGNSCVQCQGSEESTDGGPCVFVPAFRELQKLVASDASASAYFGRSVSISSDGTRAIVGTFYFASQAYVFRRTGNSWSEEQILENPDENVEGFGESVSISGDGTRVIVGTLAGVTSATKTGGKAYVFSRTGEAWSLEHTLVPSDAETTEFGRDVSISVDGARAIVGSTSQRAYVFLRSGVSWSQEGILSAQGSYSGYTVSISGDGSRAISGAHVFSRSEGAWSLEQTLEASDADQQVGFFDFGNDVAISSDGTRTIVGAYRATADGVDRAGAAYVFVHDGNSWSEEQKLVASDGVQSDNLGERVGISGDGSRAIAGAYSSSGELGAAYVYSRDGGVWSEEQKLLASDGIVDENYAFYVVAISSDGSHILVGGEFYPAGEIYDAGAVYYFQATP